MAIWEKYSNTFNSQRVKMLVLIRLYITNKSEKYKYLDKKVHMKRHSFLLAIKGNINHNNKLDWIWFKDWQNVDKRMKN